MWKGYRGAQVAWLLLHDVTGAPAAVSDGLDGWSIDGRAASSAGAVGVGLYLAIYAPARERVEV